MVLTKLDAKVMALLTAVGWIRLYAECTCMQYSKYVTVCRGGRRTEIPIESRRSTYMLNMPK